MYTAKVHTNLNNYVEDIRKYGGASHSVSSHGVPIVRHGFTLLYCTTRSIFIALKTILNGSYQNYYSQNSIMQ